MFQALTPLLKSCDLTLHLHLEPDGTLRVSGIPKRPDGAQPAALFQPFTLCATPLALDQQFPALVSAYQETRAELAEQMAQTTTQMRQSAQKAGQNKTPSRTGSAQQSTAKSAASPKTSGKTSDQTAAGPKDAAKDKTGAAQSGKSAKSTKSTKSASGTNGRAMSGRAPSNETGSSTAGSSKATSNKTAARKTAASKAEAPTGDHAASATPSAREFFVGHSAEHLRTLARKLLPKSEQADLEACDAKTLQDRLTRHLENRRTADGALPPMLTKRIADWRTQAGATA
jgi:PRTRC genetic system protein E